MSSENGITVCRAIDAPLIPKRRTEATPLSRVVQKLDVGEFLFIETDNMKNAASNIRANARRSGKAVSLRLGFKYQGKVGVACWCTGEKLTPTEVEDVWMKAVSAAANKEPRRREP